MIEKIYVMSPSGARLAGALDMVDPTGAIVIIAHGFRSSMKSRTSSSIARTLSHLGINTLRFDFYGHGHSTGEFADVTLTKALQDLHAVIGFVRDRGYEQVGLFGSSFGGMVSLLVASEDMNLFAVVLKSPVVDYAAKEIHRRGKKGIQVWKDQGTVEYILPNGVRLPLHYAFYEDSLQYAGYAYVQKITAPTLFVHGDADTVVPVEQSEQAVELMMNATLEKLSGVNHFYDKKEDFSRLLILTESFFSQATRK